MSTHRDVLGCPLCEGQGEVHRSQLIEFFSDPNLKTKIDAYLAPITPADDETAELGVFPARNRAISRRTSTAGIHSCPWGEEARKNEFEWVRRSLVKTLAERLAKV